jgi:hypothetical protein
MRGDQRRRPTRTKMSLATDSNAAAATKPLMKKLRGVQLLHNGCQQELDAAAIYSRRGSKQKRTQDSKSEDLKLEEGKPFAAVKKTKDHCNNNSCGTTRTMTMTPLRSYWGEKTNWVGGILSVIDDMRWSKHMCMPKGDRSVWETIANVATSIPFVVIGINTPRQRLATRMYSNSIIGVGVASTLYHTSRGESRRFFRFCDYSMIATTTMCLSSVLRTEKNNPRALMLGSALMIPFQPMIVTALHTSLLEATFALRTLENPQLREAHKWHAVSSLLGGALFVADGFFPDTPYIHAAWHVAAAFGVATLKAVL